MSDLEPPKKKGKDNAHALIKGAIGAVPIAGDILGVLFDMAIKPSFEKRMGKWSEEVSNVLNDLMENKGIKMEDLAGNEEFISIIAQTAKAIQTTHQDAKRTMLANAVKNSALGTIEYDKQHMFVQVIEQLSPTHITMMQEINKWRVNDPDFDFDELKEHLVKTHFNGNSALLELFIKQLQDFHFLRHIQTKRQTKEKVIHTVRLSTIAGDFLNFIS